MSYSLLRSGHGVSLNAMGWLDAWWGVVGLTERVKKMLSSEKFC